MALEYSPNSVAPNTSGYQQSSILAVSDFVRPDFQTKLFKQYGQFMDDLLLLKRMQATRPIRNASGGFHFEESFYDTYIEVKADEDTAGAHLEFAIANTQVETVGSKRTVYVTEGDLIMDMATNTRGQVTRVDIPSSGDVIVQAESLTGTSWTVPTAGKQYAIYSNAYDENTGQPNAKSSSWDKFSFKLQTLKTSALITGNAAIDQLFPETDENGNFVGNWGGVQRTQAEFRHLKSTIGQLILGIESDASGVSQTTHGMMDRFATLANGVSVDTASIGIDDLEALIDALKPNNPDNNFMGWLCRGINRPLQAALATEFQNANISAVRRQSAEMIFGSAENVESMYATFDFECVVKEGMVFNLRSFDLSYDPQVFGVGGVSGNLFANTAYFMPSGTGVDAQGMTRRHMELAYGVNGDNGQDRMLKIWETGANAPVPTNDIDNRLTHYLTHFGLDFFSLKQCGYMFDSSL
jgi:hypothetical protein